MFANPTCGLEHDTTTTTTTEDDERTDTLETDDGKGAMTSFPSSADRIPLLGDRESSMGAPGRMRVRQSFPSNHPNTHDMVDVEDARVTSSADATTTTARTVIMPGWKSAAVAVLLTAIGACYARATTSSSSTTGARAPNLGLGSSGADLDAAARLDMTLAQYSAPYAGPKTRADIHTMKWDAANGFTYDPRDHSRDLQAKMSVATELMAKTIRTYFPSRLDSQMPPFEIAYVVTDFPQTPCVGAKTRAETLEGCDVDSWSPIFTFSSVPRDGRLLPSLRGATLITLARRVERMMGKPSVIPDEKAPAWSKYELFKLPEAQEEREFYEWPKLVNKVFWRGSDWPFLGPPYENHKESMCHSILGTRNHSSTCILEEMANFADGEQAIRQMLKADRLTPRGRLVLMSRLDAESNWLDARFVNPLMLSSAPHVPTMIGRAVVFQDETRRVLGEKFRLDSKPASTAEIARYKYHVDVGGWGGTTWTATLSMLSMPGVLLHHETSMKDSYFDELTAWTHYIPVKEDLSDLREKYEWAESHEKECRQIVRNAHAWIRRFDSREGMLRHNYERLAKPLAEVLRVPDVENDFLLPFETVHADLAHQQP